MRVYEFCGWLNIPDECAGGWFEDFPHPLDGSEPTPRVSYYDRARGTRESENFQVYVMSGEPVSRDHWKGPWPEGADMIVTCPIQRVTWTRCDFPRYEVVKGNDCVIHEDLSVKSMYVPVVEFVHHFTTPEGVVMRISTPTGLWGEKLPIG